MKKWIKPALVGFGACVMVNAIIGVISYICGKEKMEAAKKAEEELGSEDEGEPINN